MKIKRRALNRGTAVHIFGDHVRFIWPCGCKRTERIFTPRGTRISAEAVSKLVKNWRANGVTLSVCPQHPEWYSKDSQLERLNSENPPLPIVEAQYGN